MENRITKIRKYETAEKKEKAKEIAERINAKAERESRSAISVLKEELVEHARMLEWREDNRRADFLDGITKSIDENDWMYVDDDIAAAIKQDMFADHCAYCKSDKYSFEKKEIPMHFATKEDYLAWDAAERRKWKNLFLDRYGEEFAWYDDVNDCTWINSEIGEEYFEWLHKIACVRPVYPPEEIARLEEKGRIAEEELMKMLAETFGEPDDDEEYV